MTENPQDPSAQSDPPQQPYTPPPPPPMAGQVPAYGQPGQAPVSPSDARMWSLFSHLGGLLLSPIVPLVIYLMYKDRDPFVRRHSAQALNFQIWAYIGYIVSFALMFILIGFLTFPAIAIAALVFSIMAAMAANRGEEYTYPLVPKLIT